MKFIFAVYIGKNIYVIFSTRWVAPNVLVHPFLQHPATTPRIFLQVIQLCL